MRKGAQRVLSPARKERENVRAARPDPETTKASRLGMTN
jgi:hypothetical protein